MGKKTATAAPKTSKEAARKPTKQAASLQEALAKNRPGPVPEGRDYLAQREKWFQRRTGKA